MLAITLPSRGTLVLLVGILFLVASGAMREFVWADLRGGAIRLRGLSRSTKVVAWMGIGFLVSLIVAIVFSDAIRSLFTLTASRRGTPGRGTLLPQPLLPITLFLLAIAFSLMLTGALHLSRSLRLVSVFVYLAVVGEFADVARALDTGEAWERTAILVCALAVPLVFAARWRAQPRPLLEFAVLFALIGATLGLCQKLVLEADQQFGGVSVAFSEASLIIGFLGVLALPFVFFIGIDIAEFGFRASGWTVDIARSKIGRWAPAVLLAGLAVGRSWTIIGQTRDQLDAHTAGFVALGYLGALGAIGMVIGAWYLIADRGSRGTFDVEDVTGSSRGGGVALVFIFFAPTLITGLLVFLTRGLITANVPWVDNDTTLRMLDLQTNVNERLVDYRAVVALLCLPLAFVLVRRQRPALALFVGSVSTVLLWTYITSDGRALEALSTWSAHHEFVDGAVTVLILGLALFWTVTRRLTDVRVRALLFVVVLVTLIGRFDFLEDPFSTEFAVAGVFVLAFSVMFDMVSIGSWANVDTKGLPRSSRLLLYLGYVIFTLVIVNWALITHDLVQQQVFTGLGAQLGFFMLGRPLLLGVVAVILASTARGLDPLTNEDEVEWTTF
ncbi:MAG: hypothetical protein QOH64_655 [Acidimicrobiaceae bacterium]